MPNPVVEALFGKGTKGKVVQWLYVRKADKGTVGARALAREAQVPYGSIAKTLKELVAAQLVVREETRHGPEYRAPDDDPRLAGLFMLLRQDSEIVARLKRVLGRFSKISYACIFGSFAKGTTHRGSDIDVLILEDEGLDRFSVMAEIAKVSKLIQREINPDFYPLADFRQQVNGSEPFALAVIGDSRINLKGNPFWQN